MNRFDSICDCYSPCSCCCIGPQGPQGPQGVPGPQGATGATGPFLSSYIEAVGSTQNVGINNDIIFDITPDYLDVVGTDIGINTSGTVFTIRRAGLYHVEWSVNLASASNPTIIGLMEAGSPASALTNANSIGNYSSGALINVAANEVPYTISLHNFGAPFSIADAANFRNIAASIRILRFADGANV